MYRGFCKNIGLYCVPICQFYDLGCAVLEVTPPRRRRLVLGPLAFGEVGVRDRVKSVLHYRRPGVWLSAAAVLLWEAYRAEEGN